jgi:uncharacterized protein
VYYGGDMGFLFIAILLLGVSLFAQHRVSSTFNKYSKVRNSRGITGAQAAARILDSNGLSHVEVERVQGRLTDHYDPRSKTLRLSSDVYDAPSVAAVGIAAHEAGHALQDQTRYPALALRSAMVPTVQFGSKLGPILFIVGIIIGLTPLAWLGVIAFAAVAVFSVVTLPVEFNASARAKQLLVADGILAPQEMEGVNKVLNAAALTYVAAALSAIVWLLRYISILSGRRN